MNKKFLIVPLLFLIPLVGGLWFLVRRGPVASAPEDNLAAFHVETFGPGLLYRYSDEQTPLRALRWLPPQAGGIQALQVVTQSDRQRLVVFKDGAQLANLLIPRPAGVREGFFNFAELQEAIVLSDVALLLYRTATSTSGELPLVMALDMPSGMLRWAHRAPGEHLALAPSTTSGAVFLYGAASPIVRLSLALQKGERLGSTPFRPAAVPLEMPEEIKTLSAFVPTGSWGFLLAHSAGLSAFSESKGWHHWPMPPKSAMTFSDSRSALAVSKGYWWQPGPGQLIQVKEDGSPVGPEIDLPQPAEPWSKDRLLLKLKGADHSGNLWFALATPSVSSPIATPLPQKEATSLEKTDSEPATLPTTPTEAAPALADTQEWITYLSLGLERVYRWHPELRVMHPVNLAGIRTNLAFPPGVNRPSAFPEFQPSTGVVLLESGSNAWQLTLEALIKSGN